MQVKKQATEGSTQAMISRTEVTRSQKQEYQWSHKKDWCPPIFFLKNSNTKWIQHFLETRIFEFTNELWYSITTEVYLLDDLPVAIKQIAYLYRQIKRWKTPVTLHSKLQHCNWKPCPETRTSIQTPLQIDNQFSYEWVWQIYGMLYEATPRAIKLNSTKFI